MAMSRRSLSALVQSRIGGFVALCLLLVSGACEDLPTGRVNDDPAGIEITTAAGVTLHRALLDGAPTGPGVEVARNSSVELRVAFLDGAGNRVNLAARGLSMRATVVITTVATFEKTGEDRGTVTGRAVGATSITFDVMRGTERQFSAVVPVRVPR